MDRREAVRIAVRAITGHRLRSVLTVVGIVIGIAAVVAFASFGASVQSDVVAEFQDTSASEVYVLSGGGVFTGSGPPEEGAAFTAPVITTRDVERIGDLDGVRAVIPRGTVPVASLSYREETVAQPSVIATTPNAFSESITDGRPFEMGARELVINEVAARQFSENLTVGSQVEITREDTDSFTVVGIATGARGGVGDFGPPEPEFYLPVDPHYRTVQESPSLGVDQRAYARVTVVAQAGRVGAVDDRVSRYIETDSDAVQLAGATSNVTVQSTEDVIGGIEAVLRDITRLVTGIGVLALIVGAFGIANIMLVSVTERTKEIGIMKAIGASNRNVLELFLFESVLLGVAGAVVGIPLGLAVGYGGAVYAEVGFSIPYGWIAIALGMGVTIGVVAGLYPAWRAARVDPIEAIRRE